MGTVSVETRGVKDRGSCRNWKRSITHSVGLVPSTAGRDGSVCRQGNSSVGEEGVIFTETLESCVP